MTKIPVLLAGFSVLLLCVRLIVQMLSSEVRVVSVDDFGRARRALDSFLIKRAAIKRILSDDDLKFVSRSGSTELRRFFLQERKMLVLHWFRTIQKQVGYLMDIHLRLAALASPSPASELKLSLQYAMFTAVSNCLIAIFWLFGPFAAQRTLTYTVMNVERFFGTFKERLEGINPAQLHRSPESLVH
jgi:hypothetical protein